MSLHVRLRTVSSPDLAVDLDHAVTRQVAIVVTMISDVPRLLSQRRGRHYRPASSLGIVPEAGAAVRVESNAAKPGPGSSAPPVHQRAPHRLERAAGGCGSVHLRAPMIPAISAWVRSGKDLGGATSRSRSSSRPRRAPEVGPLLDPAELQDGDGRSPSIGTTPPSPPPTRPAG